MLSDETNDILIQEPAGAGGRGAATLRAGFIPLVDCAPLIVAARKGFAAAEGITLELSRQTSWASLRDRLMVGMVDVAHMLAPIPIAATLGVGGPRVDMIGPMALGRGGNAVTVSIPLWEAMVAAGARAGDPPAAMGAALLRAINRRAAPPTFAMVHPFSAHNHLLRYWLAAAGIDPDRDVRLVVVPPPYMVEAIRSGQIDGFCVGAPWSSLAVDGGAGVIVTTARALWDAAPCKVLGVRSDFAAREPARLAAVIRALTRALSWCDDPTNHAELAAMLSAPDLVGVDAAIIERALSGRLVFEPGGAAVDVPDFLRFDRARPSPAHGAWFFSQMVRWRQVDWSAGAEAAALAVMRPDVYDAAVGGMTAAEADERFFDGVPFDPGDIARYLGALG